MQYLLLYDIEKLSRNILLKSYKNDGFKIINETDNYILIKKHNASIIDEDIYIKILNSYLKRTNITKKLNGKIIDLSPAFKYASKSIGFNKFDNKFEWYIRNIITKELNNIENTNNNN